MTNSELKNNGQSRIMKTTNALPATYDAFRSQFITSGIPVDLSGLLAIGCSVIGTAFSKETMLPDSLDKALFGAALATRTPAEAMEKLRQLAAAAQGTADGRLQAASGSYIGTGTSNNSSKPNSLTFGFAPKLLLVCNDSTSNCSFLIGIAPAPSAIQFTKSTSGNSNNTYGFANLITWSGNTVSWYVREAVASYQMNESGVKYYYLAVG